MFICRHYGLFVHDTKHIALQKCGIKTTSIIYHISRNKSDQNVPRRRVVVTGVGVVSPVGCDSATAWSNILNGYCGIKTLDSQKYDSLPCKIAAKISEDDLKLTTHFSSSELRSLAKSTVFALISGRFKNINELDQNYEV